MRQIIECSNLGIVKDIPADFIQLQEQNDILQQSIIIQRVIIFSMCIVIGVVIFSKVISNVQKDHKRKK